MFTLDTRISTIFNQELDVRCVAFTGRQVDGCESAIISSIDISTFLNEQLPDVNIAHFYGLVKQGLPIVVSGIGRRTFQNQSAYIAEIATLDGIADVGPQMDSVILVNHQE